jgi:hypothetical protein
MYRFTILFFCSLLASTNSCDQPSPQSAAAKLTTPGNTVPDRRALSKNFWENPELLIVHSATQEAMARQLGQQMENIDVQYLDGTEATIDRLKDKALLVIGTRDNNPAIDLLVPKLPIDIKDDALSLTDYEVSGKSAVALITFYPHPLNKQLPVAIATGLEEESIKGVLQEQIGSGPAFFSWYPWHYELYNDQRRVMMGRFDDEDWSVAEDKRFYIEQSKDTAYTSIPYEFILHNVPAGEGSMTQELQLAMQEQAEAIAAFCRRELPTQPIDCHIYPDIESKGLQLHNTQICQVNFRKQCIHLVSHQDLGVDYLGEHNALLLRQYLGTPGYAALEMGLSIRFNNQWQKKGHIYWANKLAQTDNLPPLSELFEEELLKKSSQLVMGCAAASLVDFLIEKWGHNTFLKRYANWKTKEDELANLNKEWKTWLLEQSVHQEDARPVKKIAYLKGFNFAHEGYAIYNGYGSRLAAHSLEEQASLGANSVALVPYSYMSSPRKPSFIPLMTRAGTETDEGIIFDHYYSQRLGMQTLLKPQIWLGGGSWPGDVAMENEADWQSFFDYYYRWMRHYALLAEIHEIDMLCVGVEFANATLQQGARWEQLISKLRGVYSGPMTYAANWGKEFEQLDFWDQLDFIGLNCYYPLSKKDQPGEQELSAAFTAVIEKAASISKQYDRPLVFTEIGFTSTTTPWINPHKDGRQQKYDGNTQKLCYEIVMEQLRKEQDWCQGILWWKYPSYLQHGGEGHTGFTPNDKPAEGIIRTYFDSLP